MINKKKFRLKKRDHLTLLTRLMGSDHLCKVNKKKNSDYFLGKYYSILLYQLALGYHYRYDKCSLL